MSNNPFAPPAQFQHYAMRPPSHAARGPAIGLLCSSILWLFLIALALCFNVYLLASGVAEDAGSAGLSSSYEMIVVRTGWACIIGISNVTILLSSISMMRGRNYGFAKTGAILAVIPCVSPCYVIGIPFGIWALVVLSKPEVKSDFG